MCVCCRPSFGGHLPCRPSYGGRLPCRPSFGGRLYGGLYVHGERDEEMECACMGRGRRVGVCMHGEDMCIWKGWSIRAQKGCVYERGRLYVYGGLHILSPCMHSPPLLSIHIHPLPVHTHSILSVYTHPPSLHACTLHPFRITHPACPHACTLHFLLALAFVLVMSVEVESSLLHCTPWLKDVVHCS